MNNPNLQKNLTQTIADTLASNNLSPFLSNLIAILITFFAFAFVVALLIYIRRKHLRPLFSKITTKTTFRWDDLLARNGCLTWGANIGFSILFILLSRVLFGGLVIQGVEVGTVVGIACQIYFIITVLFFLDSVMNGFLEYYGSLPVSQDIGIKGFIQALKLLTLLIGLIFIMSTLLGKSPVFFLSGLGALTAVLLLIFKDAILGFVAGIQISVNNTVKVGDWVEMPTHLADGDVIDISLTTVKIQNWDKTITSIPTYDLISKPFKNWRGMQNSGGRRIKRSIMIDMNTIKFADDAMIAELKRIGLIKPYIESRIAEIEAFNKENSINDRPRNGRSITNIGTFRAYCEAYLKAHPKIHDKMTFLVRQLAPTSKGLPLEIYVFSNDIVWANYEGIQSDIFDHLLSILSAFDLGVFQEPTGRDFAALVRKDP